MAAGLALWQLIHQTAGVPAFLDALRDPSPLVRLSGCRALAALGPDAKTAVDLLIESLKDQDGQVRMHCAATLGRVGCEAAAHVDDGTQG